MTTQFAVEKVNLTPADRVRFADTGSWWWQVQAADDRFIVLTHQAPFKPQGEVVYTIIDWQRGVRGPCNLIGNGWDFSEGPGTGARRLLRALTHPLEIDRRLRAGEASVALDEVAVEVSYRNNIAIRITQTRQDRA